MRHDVSTMHDLVFASCARYVRVLPTGLEVSLAQIVPSLCVQVLAWRSARTLYEKRRPVCRSLNGIQAIGGARACASCLLRPRCTPQICLELLDDGVPRRLLLAYTSAANFLEFSARCQKAGRALEGSEAILSVVDRGSWGEVRFLAAPGTTSGVATPADPAAT